MCLGALRGGHSLKVARSAHTVRAQCKDSPNSPSTHPPPINQSHTPVVYFHGTQAPGRGSLTPNVQSALDSCLRGMWVSMTTIKQWLPPPPLAHARPCLSTGWALNRRFEEILGPLFLWSRMEDWVYVECLYRE